MRMQQAKFISIEGVEGAGKSTVVQYVKLHLQRAGIDAYFTREPGGTVLAEKFRNLLLHPDCDEVIEPKTELLLMFAGREQHIKQRILPQLHAGKWVVSDRFIDASYAYQGGGRQMDRQFIADLDRHIVGNTYPDLTLLLDLPPALGFERTAKRSAGKDRIEQERMDFFERVRAEYLHRAKQDANRIKIIDASLTLSEVEQQVAVTLNQFMTSVAL
jgi:dTMP kinase